MTDTTKRATPLSEETPKTEVPAASASPPAPPAEVPVEIKDDVPAADMPPVESSIHPEAEADAPVALKSPPEELAWPEISADHPISKLLAELPTLIESTGHDEVYAIKLDPAGPFHTKLILQKFLRANANDVGKAKEQLKATLAWRKDFDPVRAKGDIFPHERFGGLGYVTVLTDVPGSANRTDVCTFNIYGAVKDNKKTFGELDEFLRWRVALMEIGIQKLNLPAVTTPIPDFGQGPDPHQGIQIHDYLQVSFLRQDPHVKAASKQTIETLSAYYPETLSRKFFVSVPLVMQWMFTAMKLLLSKETVKKFTVMSYANQLATELGPSVPKTYGGKAGELEEIGETVLFK